MCVGYDKEQAEKRDRKGARDRGYGGASFPITYSLDTILEVVALPRAAHARVEVRHCAWPSAGGHARGRGVSSEEGRDYTFWEGVLRYGHWIFP